MIVFADDTNIFTVPSCITAWLDLLSYWGKLSGVILNIPKSLLNFWSNTNIENIPALENVLLNHSCIAFRSAGIFNELTNKGGWKISINGDFSLLGLSYSFVTQHSEVDPQNENFNVRTKLLISFTSNTWNLKNALLPDPHIKLACALFAASDNIFDRLVNLKSLFVSTFIHKLYNCPCSIKIMALIQNQANVVVLSPSAIKSPYIKLNTLFQPFSQGGCKLVSIASIQKAISVHTIILLLTGLCDRWVSATYRRDLLRIVFANYMQSDAMKLVPFEFFSQAGFHYLFGLPLICSKVTQSGLPMLWTTYASLSNFISIPKKPVSNLSKGIHDPNQQDMSFFHQLLREPLWFNNLFLNPTTSASCVPISQVVDIFFFKDIWSIQLCSFSMAAHDTTCSPNCTHDQNCLHFWAPCIPLNIVEFAKWCSPHFVPMIIPLVQDNLTESTVFALDIQPALERTLLPACSVKILTAHFTSIRAGIPNLSLITGVVAWKHHWPQLANSFLWKAYFKLLEQEDINKSVRTAFWKLLHRCHVPKARNTLTNTAYVYCKFCASSNTQALFNPEHAIFGCPKVLQFWSCIITYVMKVNPLFDNNVSFITIISLGLHNMPIAQDYTNSVAIATHNIIGLGIKTLTLFPIDSSDSLQTSLSSFRQQFRLFIRSVVESKISAHLSSHGPNPDLYTALRTSMSADLSIWSILSDNKSTSLLIPAWSDYTYVDPV